MIANQILNKPFVALKIDIQQNIVSFEAQHKKVLPEILMLSSYPPRECGIATYSQDLIQALNNKFGKTFEMKVCALETDSEKHTYSDDVAFTLNTNQPIEFIRLIDKINKNDAIKLVVCQHEFGFFEKNSGSFIQFLKEIKKPILMVFHTVLPNPDAFLRIKVQRIAEIASGIVVMTQHSAKILEKDYEIEPQEITVIPHGTHLVQHSDKTLLKQKYNLIGKKVLSTFGLLGSGKSIETTLDALPKIIQNNPDVLFLIIGKTHPSIVKEEGERYRIMLEKKVIDLKLENHVRFINQFLPLSDLLDYLQLTDIYLFTSKDPNQAVSGTFSYAISCGCPIVSTPIPHAKEILKNESGIIIDFGDSKQLAIVLNDLLADEQLRKNISSNGLHKIASTAWENSAISHALLFEAMINEPLHLHYNLPTINLNHIKKLTTDFGIIQFSKINQPDIDSGYTLDDNARALVALCQHFELTHDEDDLQYIETYFEFIKFCLQDDGSFLNYVDENQEFTEQNRTTNLEDSNGRAIWALGYLTYIGHLLPFNLQLGAEIILKKALSNSEGIHSSRAMGFIIKGLYYYNIGHKSVENLEMIKKISNRLVQMYKHEADDEWHWFESYLTYGNGILPEALLCAWLATGNPVYGEIAKESFDFLLSKTFTDNKITIISNQSWLKKSENRSRKITVGGEQPIDIAYTVLALERFSKVFPNEDYQSKMKIAFYWFLGENHLHQIIYNPCTGGCYDGLEEFNVNLNQGAESTVSYLMARLTVEQKTVHPSNLLISYSTK